MTTIAVDIGHGSDVYERTGGKGVRVGGVVYEEHTSNSKVAEKLRAKLEDEGFKVVYGQGPFAPEVSLTDRTNYYNRIGVDLVWSIHFNAGASSANGACAFYWHTADDSKELAECYADCVREAGYETHGHGTHACVPGTWTNFHICRETKMTAVLTENGFMTNDEDFVRIFQSEKYLEDLAEIHAQAICEFYGVERGGGVSDPVDKVEPVEKPKPHMPKDPVQHVSDNDEGKRVESIYKGSEGLDFYSKPSRNDKYKVGTFGYGMGWTIREKLKVDGAYMYEVENSNGDVYYITASDHYVKVVGGSNPKPKPEPENNGSAIVPYPGHYIKQGSRGKDVKRVQRAVNVNPDGIFGPNTKRAVEDYQRRHGLSADGIVGPSTWNTMF